MFSVFLGSSWLSFPYSPQKITVADNVMLTFCSLLFGALTTRETKTTQIVEEIDGQEQFLFIYLTVQL